jgi:hypothetical protein
VLQLTLYTKDGCHLCEMLKVQLRMFQRLYPHELIEVDIAQDRDLHAYYRFMIPVLEIGESGDRDDIIVLKAPINTADLAAALRSISL